MFILLKSRSLLIPFSEQEVSSEEPSLSVNHDVTYKLNDDFVLLGGREFPLNFFSCRPTVISLACYQRASNYLSGCFRLPGCNYCSKGPINGVVWCISLTSPG